LRTALLALALACPGAAASLPVIQPWTLPETGSGAQPGLVDDARGGLLLSWVERHASGHRLRFSRWTGDAWSGAATALAGEQWFVNWADTPGMLGFADDGLAAFTLVKSGPGTYAYDVQLAFADPQGSWDEAFVVHDDGTRTEHGFVSLWREGSDAVGIAWLDGRHTDGGGHDHGGHAHGSGGAMSLRAAVIGRDGRKRAEREIDASTCDCCPTASAAVGAERWLAYRGRADGEIRDILVARRDASGGWLSPVVAHADSWFMPACPVNGPSLAANANAAYLAWYTAPDRPRVRLARLDAEGRAASPPLEIEQDTAQGRVALAADDDRVWLAWVSEDRDGASLWLACFDAGLAERGRRQVSALSRGRATGLPRLVLREGEAHVVMTDIVDGIPRLRGWRASCRNETDAPAK